MGLTNCKCSLAGTRYCQICGNNPNRRAVKITSTRSSEFTSDIIVDGVRYNVQTEKLGQKKPIILTTVHRDGVIISSKKSDYSDLLGDTDLNAKLQELMHRQHLSAVKMLKTEKPKVGKIPSEYLDDVKKLLEANNNKGALKMLGKALAEHPYNPFLLSYFGCLEAIVNKNYDRGVDICKDAIEIFKQEVPFGQDFFYPVFYLNLGRAYLAAGNKENASEAFKKGLEADPENSDLTWEAKKLGMRRRPVIPFLTRSNPMNKYMGMLLHK
jgi:hypothetical protein